MRILSPKRKAEVEEKSPKTFRWHICEDDTEWRATQTQLPPTSHTPFDALSASHSTEPEGRCGQPWRRRLSLGIGITLLAIVGAVGWVQAQIGLSKIDREVEDAVEADVWLSLRPVSFSQADVGHGQQLDEANLTEEWLAFPEPGEVSTQSKIVEVGDGWVRVQVNVQSGAANNTYHQTRVYRRTDAGWQRIPPTAAYWGNARQMETRYFIWHYFAQDDNTVRAVAPKLDLLYPDFNAALLPSTGTGKLHVQIDPEHTVHPENQMGDTPSTPLQPLIVASPSVLLLPETLAPEEWLIQAVALSLFDHLAAAAVEQYALPPQWSPIRNGLRLRLIWRQKLPLAVWREPLVQWVFGGLHANADPLLYAPPPFAHELCAHHHWWMVSAGEIDSPVLCFTHPNEQERILAFRHPYPLSVRLVQLIPSIEPAPYIRSQRLREEMIPPTAAVAFATFFEYASSTYGDDKVRMTIAALPQFESWEALIPAVYGVSLPKFEAGWNTYLAEQYGWRGVAGVR